MGNKALELVAAPTTYPVTTAEARAHLRQETTADDDLIDTLIAAACLRFTRRTGLALLESQWYLHLDDWEVEDPITIPRWPLLDPSNEFVFQYYDADNVLQTWSAMEYDLDTASRPPRVTVAYSYTYPTLYDRLGAIRITFKAGVATAADIRDYRLVQQAILMMIAHWYEHAGEATSAVQEIPVGAEVIMRELSIIGFA